MPISEKQLTKYMEESKEATNLMSKGKYDQSWRIFLKLSKIPDIVRYEPELHIFQDGLYDLIKMKSQLGSEVKKFIALADAAGEISPPVFDNIAGYYLEVLNDRDLWYKFVEKAIMFGYYKALDDVFDEKLGGYKQLKSDQEFFSKVAYLFRKPGDEVIKVGDLVIDKRGKWGVVHDKYDKGDIGTLTIGNYGGIAAWRAKECRKIRKATKEDLELLTKYYDNDLNEFIDTRKILKKLKKASAAT